MADSVSDTHSESGQSDNASYVAQPSALAALRARDVQPLIHEAGWYGLSEGGLQRIAAGGSSTLSSGEFEPRVLPTRRDSDTMSMAATLNSRRSTWESATTSAYAPSLGSYTTVASRSSAWTDEVDAIIKQDLLEEVDGILQQPPLQLRTLRCPYDVLNCRTMLDDLYDWDGHCRAHFHGYLPRVARCHFGSCRWMTVAGTGQEAWDMRLSHMQHHSPAECTVVSVGADVELLTHLWRNKVISSSQLKEVKQSGRMSATPGYMTTERSERRPRG